MLRNTVLYAPKHKPTNVTLTSDCPGRCESGHHTALRRSKNTEPPRAPLTPLGTSGQNRPCREDGTESSQAASSPARPCLPCPPPLGRAVIPVGQGFPGLSGLIGRNGDTKNPEFNNEKNKTKKQPSDSSKNRLFLVSSPMRRLPHYSTEEHSCFPTASKLLREEKKLKPAVSTSLWFEKRA